MNLLFHLCGDRNKASSRVRGYWVAEELISLNHCVTLRVTAGKLSYLEFAHDIFLHDAVIFQKTYSRYDLWLVALAHLLRKRVVFDIDDAPSRSLSNSTMGRAAQMMRRTDVVMAGSRALANLAVEAGAREIHVVPSGVRLADYRQVTSRKRADPVCLGWLGNGAHYADDLIDVLREPITALAHRHALCFRIVGACAEKRLYDIFGSIEGLKTEFVDQVDWANPVAVVDAIARFDIGLYPLNPGPFNDFKCGFKALEYMARGLPVVASRIAVNAEIVADGITGYLANDTESWIQSLEALVSDGALREKMGLAGRARIEEDFTTKRIALQVSTIIEGIAR